MSSSPVADASVSETALFIAAARALDTADAEGFIRDPFAKALAGERGMAILGGELAREWAAFGIGLRTHFTDQLILSVTAEHGVKTVLNIGAGLDTRPWRLNLPADLRWIDVDTQVTLGYRRTVLGEVPASCQVEEMHADIKKADERGAVLASVSHATTPALLVSEAVLMYLPSDVVAALAAEALLANISHWLFALASPALMQMAHGHRYERVEGLRASNHLSEQGVLETLTASRWHSVTRCLTLVDGMKIGERRARRIFEKARVAGQTVRQAPRPNDLTGVWLYGRG